MGKDIFRKEALKKLSTLDQLDSMIQIINPLGWSLLVTAAFIFIMILLWGFLGTVSYKIKGQGMLINAGGIYNVFSISSGQANEIVVKEGDIIKAGDIIAYLDQTEISEKIKILKEQLDEYSSSYSEILKLSEEGYKQQKNFLEQRQINLLSTITRGREQKRFYKEKMETEENLLKQGLITKSALIDTKQGYYNCLEDYNQKQNELKEISAKLIELNKNLEHQRFSIDKDMDEKKRQIKELEEQLKIDSAIVTKREGRVIEIKVNRGDYIREGTPVITIEEALERPENLKAIIYATLFEGKKVKPDMEIQITPSTVKREEYGYIFGRVDSVSSFPATFESMMQVLRNQKLVETLSSMGASYEIRGTLELSSSTPSGYKWSTSKGPSFSIHSGTFCDVMITIKKQPPVSFIIPFFKQVLSAS